MFDFEYWTIFYYLCPLRQPLRVPRECVEFCSPNEIQNYIFIAL